MTGFNVSLFKGYNKWRRIPYAIILTLRTRLLYSICNNKVIKHHGGHSPPASMVRFCALWFPSCSLMVWGYKRNSYGNVGTWVVWKCWFNNKCKFYHAKWSLLILFQLQISNKGCSYLLLFYCIKLLIRKYFQAK